MAADADGDAIQSAAEADESGQRYLADQNVVKVIVVPGRMVNFVVK